MLWRVLLFALLLVGASCEKPVVPEETGVYIMQVDNRQQECYAGITKTKCLWVKENGAPNWQLFYYTIEGFTYEPGYVYWLEVRREFLPEMVGYMDALYYKYTLVRVIEKKKQ